MPHLLLLLMTCWSISSSISNTVRADFCDGDHEHVNLSALDEYVWNFEERSLLRNSTGPKYHTKVLFSFCKTLGNYSRDPLFVPGCEDANVCVIRNVTGDRQIGVYRTDILITAAHGIHQMRFVSDQNCSSSDWLQMQVHVDFSCDMRHGLGRPIRLSTQPCVTIFNWPTIAACTPAVKHPILSKCYVYDDEGELRDLSHLIESYGHSVSAPADRGTEPEKQYFLNVCSEVQGLCSSSSSGTSICSNSTTTSRTEHLGDVRKSQLTFDSESGEVVLMYKSTSEKSVCKAGSFISLIRFRCPPSRSDVSYYGLESRRPFVVSRTDCEVVMEWQTDYACPAHVYEVDTSPKKCGIQVDDTFLDLTPLHDPHDDYIIGNVTGPGNQSLEIVLNVCGGLNTRHVCPELEWKSDSVCMMWANGSSSVMGSVHESRLIYADGEVYLTYPARQLSSCSGHAQTVIHFVCDSDAGKGTPVFISFSDCVLSFEWKTSHVCLPHLQPLCYVMSDNGAIYDLSPLRRKFNETSWPVVLADYRSSRPETSKMLDKTAKINLNVCGFLQNSRSNGTKCSDKSSACIYDDSGLSVRSLGQFRETLHLDPDTQQPTLRYSQYEGSGSNGTKNLVSSTIVFKCAPGNMESLPKLVNISAQAMEVGGLHTNFLFEWRTGAACPLVKSFGSDCVVFDQNLGLKFDLNPLHEELHDIEMHQDNYIYYLNICGGLKSDYCTGSDVGACRVEAANKNNSLSLGRYNRNVTYWNGVLTLLYDREETGGRQTVISLVCDETDSRHPEMISQQNNTFTFRMFTRHACPDLHNVVPCVWSNGTHEVDLSSLGNATDNHFDMAHDLQNKRTTIIYFSFCRPLTRLLQEESNCRPGSAACQVVMENGTVVSTVSLGIPRDPPSAYFGNDNLSLIYNNGDVCGSPEHPTRFSTKINFVCDEDEGEGFEQSIPRSSDSCVQEIEFKTDLVCHAFPRKAFPSSPKPKPPAPSSQDQMSSAALFLVVITILVALVVVLFVITSRTSAGSLVSRLRFVVRRELIPQNRIFYYSQVPAESQTQLLPMKEVDGRLL